MKSGEKIEVKKCGLAIDIDDTISWTFKHYVDILEAKFGNPENLTVDEIIKKYRFGRRIPYWQTKEALKWISSHTFSNDAQESIPLIEDANVVVRKISKIIPVSAYITARPEVVSDGTKRWLAKHNFPEAPVVARGEKDLKRDGNRWKAEILAKSFPKILGIIDDNPGLPSKLPRGYRGTIYLYGRAKFDTGKFSLRVVPCRDWNSVLEKVAADTRGIFREFLKAS